MVVSCSPQLSPSLLLPDPICQFVVGDEEESAGRAHMKSPERELYSRNLDLHNYYWHWHGTPSPARQAQAQIDSLESCLTG